MGSPLSLRLGVDPGTPPRRLRLGLAANVVAATLLTLILETPRPVVTGMWFFAFVSVTTVVDYRDALRRSRSPAWAD